MNIKYIGHFVKHFNQRVRPNPTLLIKFKERVDLFIISPNTTVLKDHQLKGKKRYLRSFSITGDFRVVYFIKDGDAYFVDIGSHNQVY